MTALAHRPNALRFLAAWGQSAIGNGIGYVALLLLAYDSFHSAWAVSAILLADYVPAMLLGPVFGAVVDRVPRRGAAIAADVIGCAAFVALAFAGSFGLVLVLALLAGIGAALANPAAMAGLPEVVEEDDLPAATSAHTTLEEIGLVAGPLAGALILAGGSVSVLLLINGISFALSALLLLSVRFTPRGAVAAAAGVAESRPSLWRSTIDGLRGLRALNGARTLIFTSTIAVFFYGVMNVSELLFATEELDAGASSFSILVAAMSIGMTAGALAGARSSDGRRWRRDYLLGLALMGAAMLAISVAQGLAVVAVIFACCGFGNGIAVVHERLLLQRTVPAHLHGRVFGIRRMLVAWAFCLSYVGAGAFGEALGTRTLLMIAGAGMLVAFLWGVVGLRGAWVTRRALAASAAA